MTAELLRVEKLEAQYGATRVLHGIDLSLREGGIATLLGANGAGKTTTLRAICGMVRRKGSVIFDGASIEKRATEDIARLGIAHVPDGRGTFLDLTTEENLRLGGHARGADRRALAEGIDRMYGYFPKLGDRRKQQAGTLSGGEQQMLAIARALMMRPRLLLLDEPSFGLAPKIVAAIFEILRAINRDEKVAILLVEQNAAIAMELADHVFVLETGRIVVSGEAAAMRGDETIRRSYLGY
ncbi:MAG: ABC transporter ATP-binding protein [Bacillota bacterium]